MVAKTGAVRVSSVIYRRNGRKDMLLAAENWTMMVSIKNTIIVRK